MAKLVELKTNKGHTYATRENAIRAVNKKFPDDVPEYAQLLMQDTDGRCVRWTTGASGWCSFPLPRSWVTTMKLSDLIFWAIIVAAITVAGVTDEPCVPTIAESK